MGKKLISIGIAVFILAFCVSNMAHSKKKSYGNVATVAQKGKAYKDPVVAMEDYEKWCGTPSSNSPCLLKIMPGIYDIGSNSLVMQSFIDIEGSGENITKIVGNTGNSGVVEGASNAELRFLSVENTGGSSDAIAIYYDFQSPKILYVTAIASGGSGTNCGVYIYSSLAPAINLKNVTATASGGDKSYGIWYVDCRPTIRNIIATASGGATESYGVFDQNDAGGFSTIENSVISGSTGSIKSVGFGSAKIASTRLEGIVANTSADPQPTCAGVWDESFNFYSDCCPGLTCP